MENFLLSTLLKEKKKYTLGVAIFLLIIFSLLIPIAGQIFYTSPNPVNIFKSFLFSKQVNYVSFIIYALVFTYSITQAITCLIDLLSKGTQTVTKEVVKKESPKEAIKPLIVKAPNKPPTKGLIADLEKPAIPEIKKEIITEEKKEDLLKPVQTNEKEIIQEPVKEIKTEPVTEVKEETVKEPLPEDLYHTNFSSEDYEALDNVDNEAVLLEYTKRYNHLLSNEPPDSEINPMEIEINENNLNNTNTKRKSKAAHINNANLETVMMNKFAGIAQALANNTLTTEDLNKLK